MGVIDCFRGPCTTILGRYLTKEHSNSTPLSQPRMMCAS